MPPFDQLQSLQDDFDVPAPAVSPSAFHLAVLRQRYDALDAEALLAVMLREVFPGRIALVSSFGTEAAVLLDLVAAVDPATPVVFLDTGQLFDQTLQYRDTLVSRLGLTDVRVQQPDARALAEEDPEGQLWRTNPDRCCALRKVAPLTPVLAGFDAWITGRKRFQGGARGVLSTIETDDDGRIKLNPLAGWSRARIEAHFAARGLPRHPLEAQGYLSIGCLPCTDRVAPGEDARAGRWRGRSKTECGIHAAPQG